MRTRNTRSTLRKLARVTSSHTPAATGGTHAQAGTCARLKAAAMPLNSATVVPKLATRRASMANAVTLRLNFSRMSAARPLPVTAPIRAPISCVTARMGVISTSSHSRL